MMVHIFLLFPCVDEVLDQTPFSSVNSVKESISLLKEHLRKENIDFRFCYDSTELETYVDAVGVVEEDKEIINHVSNLKMILSRNSVDVTSYSLAPHEHVFAEWNPNVQSLTSSPISTLLQNLCYYENAGVFSFNSSDSNRSEIDIVEDAIADSNLPRLLRIPLFICTDDGIDWLRSLAGNQFAIYHNPNFLPTSLRWNKQKIYQHISTGDYWYFDFFHVVNGRPHYEVFDVTGKHKYEAEFETGAEIPGSKSKSKSISHLLHGQ